MALPCQAAEDVHRWLDGPHGDLCLVLLLNKKRVCVYVFIINHDWILPRSERSSAAAAALKKKRERKREKSWTQIDYDRLFYLSFFLLLLFFPIRLNENRLLSVGAVLGSRA